MCFLTYPDTLCLHKFFYHSYFHKKSLKLTMIFKKLKFFLFIVKSTSCTDKALSNWKTSKQSFDLCVNRFLFPFLFLWCFCTNLCPIKNNREVVDCKIGLVPFEQSDQSGPVSVLRQRSVRSVLGLNESETEIAGLANQIKDVVHKTRIFLKESGNKISL